MWDRARERTLDLGYHSHFKSQSGHNLHGISSCVKEKQKFFLSLNL